MKGLWIALLALLFTAQAQAQNVRFTGQVLDEPTQEGMPFANVTVLNAGQQFSCAMTDFDGYFTLDLAPGLYTFRLSYVGYPSVTVDKVEVSPTHISEVFYMKADTGIISCEFYSVPTLITPIGNPTISRTFKSDELEKLPFIF
jgi:hypothetical protein